jgi:hypothetical protein
MTDRIRLDTPVARQETLRNHDRVAGPEFAVGHRVAAFLEVFQLDRKLARAAVGRPPQDVGVVAVGRLGQAADRQHRIERGHAGVVGQAARGQRAADDPDAVGERAGRLRHRHGRLGLAQELRQPRLQRVGERLRRAADRLDLAGQRQRDAPIGAHHVLSRQLGLAAHLNREDVVRADLVERLSRRRCASGIVAGVRGAGRILSQRGARHAGGERQEHQRHGHRRRQGVAR